MTKGKAVACTELGLMYTQSEGVKQDNFKAKDLFGKACEAGENAGCSNLGNLYRKGEV